MHWPLIHPSSGIEVGSPDALVISLSDMSSYIISGLFKVYDITIYLYGEYGTVV